MASTKVKDGEKRQGLGTGVLFLPASPSLPGTEKNETPVSHTRMGWDESGMGLRMPLSPRGVLRSHCSPAPEREGELGPADALSAGGQLFPGVCFTRRCHNPLTVCLKALSLYS